MGTEKLKSLATLNVEADLLSTLSRDDIEVCRGKKEKKKHKV